MIEKLKIVCYRFEESMISRLMKWLVAQRSNILTGCGIVIVYLLLFALGITCPIKFLTGISCPGCGMSRAWFHAITLDFAGAFSYHPLFWLVPIGAILLVLQNKFPRAVKISLGICIVALLLVYILRLLDPDCTVTVFQPSEGIFLRLFSFATNSLRGFFAK